MISKNTVTAGQTKHGSKTSGEARLFKVYAAALLCLWTVVIGLSFYLGYRNALSTASDSAIIQARTAYEKDVVYRRWNAMNNVYAELSPKIPSNPYLEEYRLDIPTEHGFTLTKINPAYMTRLVHELGALDTGTLGHVTSVNPIRPENMTDEWENAALGTLEENPGLKEITEIQEVDGATYMRFMGGLAMEKSCMGCHPNYIEGAMRGGIGIAVPMGPFWESAEQTIESLAFSHFGIWLVGFGTMLIGSRKMLRRIGERDKAQADLELLTEELEEKVIERTRDVVTRQSLLQSFMDNTDAGVYMKNTRQEYMMANRSMAELLGENPEDIIGRAGGASDNDMSRRMLECEKKVLDGKSSLNVEIIVTPPDGTNVPSSLFLFPIFNMDKELEGVGGMLVDITKRKRMEEELLEAKNIAERANQSKNDFLANISHEIRTPLNGVIGMADLLIRSKPNPDQASMIAVIKTSGSSLLAVLNDVLDFSKIEAGKIQLEMLPFGLRSMLFDSIKGLAPIAYKKGLELIVNIEPRVPDHLLGDRQRIGQIVLNLLSNAIKFTEKGEVSLAVRQIKSDSHKATLRISVTDTGIGVSPEKQQKIFAAFVQADTSTTRKFGGTGLGLAISSKLADLMHSKLHLESQPDCGSTLWFDLDLTRLAESDAAQPVISETALKGYRALLVDDNATNRRIMLEQLSAWKMEVTSAPDVDEALRLLRAASGSGAPFDLVLTDMQMPFRDGIDLLTEMKSDEALKEIPIVLLSSGTPDERKEELARFSARLSKPVNPTELAGGISAALGLWESIGMDQLQEEAQHEHARISKQSFKILLVEDMEMNQLVASRMLTDLGHEVGLASDGQHALDLMLKNKYDIVFMDIQMPVMDGMVATKVIRQHESENASLGRTPIVAMTAHAMKGDKEKYLEAGMDSYISKPVLITNLIEIIDEIAMRFELKGRASVAGTRDEATASAAKIYMDLNIMKLSFGGDESLTCQSMRIYMRDAPILVDAIGKAIEAGDNKEAAAKSHALKSITGYYTKDSPYQSCLSIEKAGRAGLLPQAKITTHAQFAGLKEQIDVMLREMQHYVDEHNCG